MYMRITCICTTCTTCIPCERSSKLLVRCTQVLCVARVCYIHVPVHVHVVRSTCMYSRYVQVHVCDVRYDDVCAHTMCGTHIACIIHVLYVYILAHYVHNVLESSCLLLFRVSFQQVQHQYCCSPHIVVSWCCRSNVAVHSNDATNLRRSLCCGV